MFLSATSWKIEGQIKPVPFEELKTFAYIYIGI